MEEILRNLLEAIPRSEFMTPKLQRAYTKAEEFLKNNEKRDAIYHELFERMPSLPDFEQKKIHSSGKLVKKVRKLGLSKKRRGE